MLKQFLNLKLSQKLSPQQIQLMKLIQLPTQAFEQRLLEEMNENPALEAGKEDEYEADEFANEDYDDYDDAESDRIEADDINIDEYLSDDDTPDYKTQVNNYSDDEEREIAEFLVGSIDDMGYIRRSVPDIVDDMAFTQGIYTDEAMVEKMLTVIHELEPSGVGARDLQECLLLQLKHKTPTEYVDLATDIIENQFEAFTKKHYDKLLQKYGVSNEQLKKAVHEIEKLNPKPGGSFTGNNKITENVVPDFAIRIIDGELELTLNGR